MIKNIHHSFSSRLFLGIFSIITPLLFALLYYTFTHSKTLMLEHLKLSEEQALKSLHKNIQRDTKQLKEEINFLTQLSVMDDIVVEDMDNRILQLLEAKKSSSKFAIEFEVSNQVNTIIVSTSNKAFDTKQGLVFTKPIYSSLEKNQRLGLLKLYLPLEELRVHFSQNSKFSIDLLSEKSKEADSNVLFKFSQNIHLEKEQKLLLSRTILQEELETQLTPLKTNLILLALLMLLFLLLLVYFISRKISKPILELSNLMKRVSHQKAYHLRSNIDRSDEVGTLSQSFNALLEIIQKNIAHIEAESADRMQQFTDLVESFSKITQQNNAQKIDEALNEVKLLAKEHQTPSVDFLSSIETLAKLQHERIKLQETQMKLLEEATHLAQNRSDFITQISHEFKTPLNSIIGFSQVIEHEQLLNAPYDKMARNIEKSGQHLLLLVNQVLNVANQNSVNETLVLSTFSLNALLLEVIETLSPQSQKMCIHIEYNASKTFNIFSDQRMIKQVLINLIANAIKFSNHKDIFIELREINNKLSVHIQDQGIGMNQQSMKNLFVPFVRLANASGLKGTGLGLALAQSYMRKLGGTIEAKSAGINLGSEFIIRINQ